MRYEELRPTQTTPDQLDEASQQLLRQLLAKPEPGYVIVYIDAEGKTQTAETSQAHVRWVGEAPVGTVEVDSCPGSYPSAFSNDGSGKHTLSGSPFFGPDDISALLSGAQIVRVTRLGQF